MTGSWTTEEDVAFLAEMDGAGASTADHFPGVPVRANGAEPEAPPFALRLDDFLTTRSETPSVLLGDEREILLPTAGLLILFAKGGRGKTTLTTDAAFHLASGCEWLGFVVPRPLRVLLIENEGPREPFREKLAIKRRVWDQEIRGEIFVYVEDWGALTLSPESIVRLRRFVEEHQIDLIIGDPLDSLGVRGVGSPEDTREFLKLLVAAGLTRDVAFWLLHHPRKVDTEDELDEVSGAWGGRVDSMLKLEKLDGSRARLSFPKIRWSRRGNRPALILAFDPETEGFAVTAEEQEQRDYPVEIEELLGDGLPRTVREIAASTESEKPGIGASEAEVKKALEGNASRFESFTGDEAKAFGRRANAVLWQLRRPASVVSVVSPNGAPAEGGSFVLRSTPPYIGRRTSNVEPTDPGTTSHGERSSEAER